MALDLAFEAMGDGPPLLILHGLFGSAATGAASRASWRAAPRDQRRPAQSRRVAVGRLDELPEMADDVLR